MSDPLVPKRVEVHEAGHAVAATVFGIPLSAITVAELDQKDATSIGGFVRVESNLFVGEDDVHIRVPIPSNLPASPWHHAIFLLAGLAAELLGTPELGPAIHPQLLRFTAEDDLRLIREILAALGSPSDVRELLLCETVEFVFGYWPVISYVADLLISEQRVQPILVADLVRRNTGEGKQSSQTRKWVTSQLLQTMDLAGGSV